MTEVSEIVRRAYAVFHRYPRKFAASTMHWTIEDPEIRAIQRRVKATKLKSLDPDTLREVVWNAADDPQSFKHFLPRALECISVGSWSLGDLAVRLQPEDIRSWPEEEIRVLRDFLSAQDAVDPVAGRLLQACNEQLSVPA